MIEEGSSCWFLLQILNRAMCLTRTNTLRSSRLSASRNYEKKPQFTSACLKNCSLLTYPSPKILFSFYIPALFSMETNMDLMRLKNSSILWVFFLFFPLIYCGTYEN
jgi:hypothetical protein